MVISPDDYRWVDGEYIFTDENERLVWPLVHTAWQEAASRKSVMVMMVGLPRSGKSTWARANDAPELAILDSTGINEERRQPFIEMARKAGAKCLHAVVMATPYNVCVARNRDRKPEPLSDFVMERMDRRLTKPFERDGFDSVTMVSHLPWICVC